MNHNTIKSKPMKTLLITAIILWPYLLGMFIDFPKPEININTIEYVHNILNKRGAE